MTTNARDIPWQPSPEAARVHLKSLGATAGWVMQLMRWEAGASLSLGSGPIFLYVLEGELIRDGHRLWPGASETLAGGAPGEARTEIGCVFLALRRGEVSS
jgi:hypothetical protein